MQPVLLLALAAAPQLDAPDLDATTLSLPTAADRPVLFDEPGDGRVWAAGATWKASFGAEGVTYVPYFGSDTPRLFPVRMQLAGARVGGVELDLGEVTAVERDGDSVSLRRGAVREVWHLAPDSVEQTFVLDGLPARGELVVRIDVETDLDARMHGEALRFESVHGSVEYGAAIALDARGTRVPVQRGRVGARLELRVDADFVRSARMPLVIDPVITTIPGLHASANEQRHPDAAYGHALPGGVTQDEYVVVWEEVVSQSDSDVYSVAVRPDGSVRANSWRVIDSTLDAWREPRVAYCRASESFVTVAERRAQGASLSQIHGRRRHMTTDLVGNAYAIANNALADLSDPDIGGDAGPGTSGFLVVWQHRFGALSDRDVYGVALDSTGIAFGPNIPLASGGDDDHDPDVSRGTGVAFFGHRWHNVVWTREANGGERDVMGRRVTLGGGTTTAEFEASVPGEDSWGATASATVPGPQMHDGSLPFAVALRSIWQGGPLLRTAYCGNAGRHAGTSLTSRQGLVDPPDPFQPRVGSTYTGLAFAYAAIDGNDVDLRVDTGGPTYNGNYSGWYVGLGEAAVPVADAIEGADDIALATVAEGGSTQDGLVLFWSRSGTIEGALFDPVGDFGSPVFGGQFCSYLTNPNSTGEKGWLRGLGSRDAVAPKTIEAERLPAGAFGYLLVSDSTGSATPPASQGHLCIGGEIGRYVDQVQPATPDGRMTFLVRPYELPRPNGSVAAAPGEVWYFQVWHRDSGNGVVTSNTTSGLLVTFE